MADDFVPSVTAIYSFLFMKKKKFKLIRFHLSVPLRLKTVEKEYFSP